jgi:spermidine/putrescine transport system substrate-binding protein
MAQITWYPRPTTRNRSSYSLLWLLVVSLVLLTACRPVPASATTPEPATEITFIYWAGMMPQSILDDFETEYGVKVNYVIYESTDELYENLDAGEIYDVIGMDNGGVSTLIRKEQLAAIDYANVPNFKNVLPSFRDLAFDPRNKHSIPYTWGTTGLLVRTDLVDAPIKKWSDLWEGHFAGKIGIWDSVSYDNIAIVLLGLGYSVNSTDPDELEEVYDRLMELQDRIVILDNFPDAYTSAPFLARGDVTVAMGWSLDAVEARNLDSAIEYILPEEGTILWGENLVIPANSPNKAAAELFINFLLRPEISARFTEGTGYASTNEAALPYLDASIRNDPLIHPPASALENAQVSLPLSLEDEELYDALWQRFMSAFED